MIVFQSLMLFIVWYCSFYLFFFLFALVLHNGGRVNNMRGWWDFSSCWSTINHKLNMHQDLFKKKKTFVLNVTLRSAKDDGLLSGCLLPSLSPSLLLPLSPPLSRSCLLFIFLQIKTVKISLLFKWATCVFTNEDVLCLNRCDLNNSITCGEF